MGRRKYSAPKRGSLAFLPRARAKSVVPRIRYWPEVDAGRPVPLAFAGYKVGMGHVVYLENNENSPYYGQEVFAPITILETPPLFVLGIRFYKPEVDKWVTAWEEYSETYPEYVKRRIKTFRPGLSEEKPICENGRVRLIVCTQPWKAGIRKKTPEIFEVQVGGKVPVEEKLEYARSLLGKELTIEQVFEPGQFVDVIAVTKGKGFAGVIKRWGVKRKHHRSRKTVREVGSIGPWHPANVMYTVPRAGQLGFHRRTIYNCRILKIAKAEEEPILHGFHRYGLIKTHYVFVKGSVPGPQKRLIKLRYPVRPKPAGPVPQLVHVNLAGSRA
ncbi:TPA: 50S ribosomal protein L3 [Candidatus Micrarchaeota archaeon]|nr:50S ribosomal protein L3 [Candidatus Micrarchaeota archaeon]